MRVAKRIEDLQPSGIRKFFDLVLGMKEVISLGVGEPDFTKGKDGYSTRQTSGEYP